MKRLRNFSMRWLLSIGLCLTTGTSFAAPLNIPEVPLYVGNDAPPLALIVMDKSHAIYSPAYNDNDDINGDGVIDYKFMPNFTYYGIFDSGKCYAYSGSNAYFYPISIASGDLKTCPGNWSGNFLNYLTTTKLDVFRKMLYGGYRVIDADNATVIERAYIPQDAHSSGKEYRSVAIDGYDITQYTPLGSIPSSGKAHLFANTTLRNSGAGEPRLRVVKNQSYRIWDWVGIERPIAGSRALNGWSGPTIKGITDYIVRVKVCDPGIGLEANCQLYPNSTYKPIGVLQKFGQNDAMYFGLLSGSYNNNLQGGVLRKNVSSISDEVDSQTGKFYNITNGVISTLNRLAVYGFSTSYEYSDCMYIATREINNGECRMWGNPIGEMLYEATRYFAGKKTPTAAFDYTSGVDTGLNLPKATWIDPYDTYPHCSRAIALVVSASQPSYDSNAVPGSTFGGTGTDLMPAPNVSQMGQSIFSNSGYSNVLAMIGQVGGSFDGTPTPKNVTSFGNIRGLSPENINDQGSFSTASMAYYAWLNDLNPASGKQSMDTMVVAFAPPLAEIKFNVGGKTITLAPFAKTGSGGGVSPTQGNFQPSNEIAAVFIEDLTPTSALFRVNFSDIQQGGDYDMDAIVKYQVTVNPNATLTVTTQTLGSSTYFNQHLGYVISGTTADGVYLTVQNLNNEHIDYFLDTPPNQGPGGLWQDNQPLPTQNTRTFTPGNVPSLTFFNSPLWYAAKWGGFHDANNNLIPDVMTEYSTSDQDIPDNYISGSNPTNLDSQLKTVLQKIVHKTGTIAQASTSNRTLNDSSILFAPQFESGSWQGDVRAYQLDSATGGVKSVLWTAASKLNNMSPDSRTIITYDTNTHMGKAFRWSDQNGISDAQKSQLNTNSVSNQNDNQGENRLNYIRGSHANETQNSGLLRNRESVLGDIVDSKPVYVGAPTFAYPDTFGNNAPENSVPYATFRSNMKNRAPMVYVGANDGMLHAFDAATGIEKLAYIPGKLFSKLPQLTHANYVHSYYVNATPTIVDAFVDGQWKTLLAGTFNSGGQGVYVLHMTDPNTFQEANAASLVKFEFTDTDDKDMGFSYSQPSIVRLANGTWAAVFGNGYNNTVSDSQVSTTGNAVLYVVDLNTGALIKKFDTKIGTLQDPKAQNRPNGMSTPTVTDIDGNTIADYIYVGDLFGNLWKINITATEPAQWDFHFYSGNNPSPFFVASDPAGNRQPITTAPAVSGYAFANGGFTVYLGTGQFIEAADKQDTQIQSIYGLFDQDTGIISGRNALLSQQILTETTNNRTISNEDITALKQGWVLDLAVNGNPQGERLLSPIRYMNKKVIFTTLVPSNDPCDYGGKSWVMQLNAPNGGRLSFDAFKAPATAPSDETPSSGILSSNGFTPMPAILQAGKQEYLYLHGTAGQLNVLTGNPGEQVYGRQSWREVQ